MTDLAVIMSVYYNDKLEYLKKSVESILNQTYSEFDFFIVCDGPVSPDIDNYLDNVKDKRIKLYRIENNGGLAKALNLLLINVLQSSEYKFIARMDADDVSNMIRFEKQHSFLLSNSDISSVGSWYEEIDEKGKHLTFRNLPTNHSALRKLYLIKAPFAHPSVMFHRRLIEIAGYYPTDTFMMEDNVLWGNSLKKGLKFANIPEYLLKYRIDILFFKRRSGIRYGRKYIVSRFKINKSLDLPLYAYILSFLIGCIKMTPSFVLKYLYLISINVRRLAYSENRSLNEID